MGFLGGDNSEADDLADQQLKSNQAELEEKKKSLFQTRLDIIKGHGGSNWEPSASLAEPDAPIPRRGKTAQAMIAERERRQRNS